MPQIDISGVGVKVKIIAVPTFPQGFDVSEFADDASAVETPAIKISESAKGLNGDKVVWAKSNVIPVTLNVLPNTVGDENLQILWNTGFVAKNRLAVVNNITMIITYPTGKIITLTDGNLADGKALSGIQQTGRQETKPYAFEFGNII